MRGDRGQITTIPECIASDGSDGLRNDEGLYPTAIPERITSNAINGARYFQGRYLAAIIKRPFSDGCDGIRKFERGQRTTFIECITTNGFH
jgi:hypothetical protein